MEDTVSKLKKHDFENLDIKNLIEEVEALGISQKKELISRLMILLEHLLKRLYVDSPYDYNAWERTIRNQRAEIDLLISQVPSLQSRWEISFNDAWQRALLKVKKEYQKVSFPEECPFEQTIETILNEDIWGN
ncbi:MAG: DUF29 domain-containing protein [Woronichinia naegeliana WA131]|uniref:DUF29 domain-containing protein n=1 Tax=Woronichinia naegeliana WA131 TaxID=2824559 RepID=A0A977PY46_9CYAN|nr:MAG: DUF29 domain-containing protein [Woronichinia naegeliana WA131]